MSPHREKSTPYPHKEILCPATMNLIGEYFIVLSLLRSPTSP